MFQFKQFTIDDQRSAMKIGTDGILLGCWAAVSTAKNVLDIGTGCGVIALQCAQKNETARIIGLEIDELATADANDNFKNSPWANRLSVINQTLQNFSSSTNSRFDTLISNPPFFENSQKARAIERLNARHTDHLHYIDIFEFSQNHLANNGSIQLILPSENAEKCVQKALEFDLAIMRICKVRPVPHKASHRWLLHFIKTKANIACETTELTIETGHKRHEYTETYKRLCKDFYLHF
jgi:tRNA1Val (adenine37-N6)-methyltransferase